MKIARLLAAAVPAAFAVSIGLAQTDTTDDPASPAEPDRAAALEQWGKIYQVFAHPRCTNCHVPSDHRPRWAGPSFGLATGEWIYHGMNISGGPDRNGRSTIPCSACHAETNAELPHGPPGAPHWQLAPVQMSWFEKPSSEVCAQMKDPAQTGGRSLADIAHHIGHDPLVLWAWEPGPGREPPPFSAEETVASLLSWAAAGAPCPAAE